MSYRGYGVERVSRFLPEALCDKWCLTLEQLISTGKIRRRVYQTPADPAILNAGGTFDHYICDGFLCAEHMPDMLGAYLATRHLISVITGEDVVASPYPRSAVNLNRYDPPGGQMSAHYDSNPISAMLYLTTNADGLTTFLRHGHPWHCERPIAGDLLVFKGRDIEHRAEIVTRTPKVVGIWNFYTASDTWRPPGMDDFMYGDRCL